MSDGPNSTCYPCSPGGGYEHERCRGYTYPLETYRCACAICAALTKEGGDRG